jgi:hypothetical protein
LFDGFAKIISLIIDPGSIKKGGSRGKNSDGLRLLLFKMEDLIHHFIKLNFLHIRRKKTRRIITAVLPKLKEKVCGARMNAPDSFVLVLHSFLPVLVFLLFVDP